MIEIIRDNYRIYGLIIVKITKRLLVLDYGFSNVTFETPNRAFTHETIEAPNDNDYHEPQPKMNCMIGLCFEY
jgi:hypothetical protein